MPNFSDWYALHNKRFRCIPPTRQTFQIHTANKPNFSDAYTLKDKRFRLIQDTGQTFQIYARCKPNSQIDTPCKTNVPYS